MRDKPWGNIVKANIFYGAPLIRVENAGFDEVVVGLQLFIISSNIFVLNNIIFWNQMFTITKDEMQHM